MEWNFSNLTQEIILNKALWAAVMLGVYESDWIGRGLRPDGLGYISFFFQLDWVIVQRYFLLDLDRNIKLLSCSTYMATFALTLFTAWFDWAVQEKGKMNAGLLRVALVRKFLLLAIEMIFKTTYPFRFWRRHEWVSARCPRSWYSNQPT